MEAQLQEVSRRTGHPGPCTASHSPVQRGRGKESLPPRPALTPHTGVDTPAP